MIVVITEAAELDLIQIGEHIARDNHARAVSFVQELLDHCLKLSDMPRMYPLVPRYEHWGVRRCVHGNYLIFYRLREAAIDIVHILHGAQDFEAILFPDGK